MRSQCIFHRFLRSSSNRLSANFASASAGLKVIILLPLGICSIFIVQAQSADSARRLFDDAMVEKAGGRHKSAYDKLAASVSLDSGNVDAFREMGVEAMEIRQYEVAKRSFSRVLQTEPDDTLSISRLGTLYFWTRKWDDAIRYGKRMEELKIGTDVNYLLGKSYWEKEDYSNAFRYLDAAYKDQPANPEIPMLIARGLFDLSNYKTAVKYYGEAIALDSSKVAWIYEAAIAYAAIPDDITAIRYYELAMRKGYKVDNDFMENLSDSYVAAGMPEKAIDMQKSLLEKRPGDLALMYSIAETYYRMGKYDNAIAQWETVLANDNKNARALYMIGLSLQKKGQDKKGKMACDKAIEMDPSLKYFRQVYKW